MNLIWLFTAAIKLAYMIFYQPKQLIHKFNLARWKIRKVDVTNTSGDFLLDELEQLVALVSYVLIDSRLYV